MEAGVVVFSHLRWNWVWQRPQHLISRIGKGGRVWFVEEPLPAPVDQITLGSEVCADGLTRLWLEVPDEGRHVGFEAHLRDRYVEELRPVLAGVGSLVAWIYSPLALDIALAQSPDLLVFDVMDDLASFKDAPAELVTRHRQALRRADVVFTGGRTLHRGVSHHRPDAHLFPSGVEPEHYEAARRYRAPRSVPVAGYVGVIDERIDLDLLAGLADALPGWEIQMVGPVAKIDPAQLPRRSNIRYLGAQPYERLPEVMGGFDVALMPFALNEATRSISPTKTLEYLAAGLPVVSTRIDDVVASFQSVVDLRDDAAGFAEACRRARDDDVSDRDRQVRPLLLANHWDTIAARMARILGDALYDTATEEVPA